MPGQPPAPDQSAPDQGAPPQDDQQSGSGPIGQLINQVHDGLTKLAEVAKQMPPEIQKGFSDLVQNFEQLVQAATQGGSQDQQQPGGPAPMESGGNPNAQPAGY